jgi:hypothetical protein
LTAPLPRAFSLVLTQTDIECTSSNAAREVVSVCCVSLVMERLRRDSRCCDSTLMVAPAARDDRKKDLPRSVRRLARTGVRYSVASTSIGERVRLGRSTILLIPRLVNHNKRFLHRMDRATFDLSYESVPIGSRRQWTRLTKVCETLDAVENECRDHSELHSEALPYTRPKFISRHEF